MEQTFTTKVEIEIDYDSLAPAGFDFDSRYSKAVIKYGMTLELREWGIKGIYFYVPEQEIDIVIELLGKDEEDSESFDCKVMLKECTIDAGKYKLNDDIFPSTLVLNLKNFKMIPSGKLSLSFQAEATGELQFEGAA